MCWPDEGGEEQAAIAIGVRQQLARIIWLRVNTKVTMASVFADIQASSIAQEASAKDKHRIARWIVRRRVIFPDNAKEKQAYRKDVSQELEIGAALTPRSSSFKQFAIIIYPQPLD